MPETPEVNNSLRCPNCNEYRFLIFQKRGFSSDKKAVGYNLPFYECRNCQEIAYAVPEDEVKEMAREHLNNLSDGCYEIPIIGENEKFDKFDGLNLIYDARDYYYLPGLKVPWDKGFLTPVFFDIKLLLSYNHDPDYRVYLNSFSTVSIIKGDNPIMFYGFGVNRNGKLFTWLGDLYEFLSEPENKEHLHRFLSYNIESDHDIISNFYFAQIEASVEESDNEGRIFDLIINFGELMFSKFGIKVYDSDIVSLKNEYKSPIINGKDQVFNAYKNLNSLLIESLNKKSLKEQLKDDVSSKELKGLGSLKLLNLFMKHKLSIENSEEVISPMFVLYDLRILDSHLSSDEGFKEDYSDCKQRMGVSESMNYIDFFKEMVSRLIAMFEELNENCS